MPRQRMPDVSPSAPSLAAGRPARGALARGILLALAMALAAAAAVQMKPTRKIADQGPKIDLEAMIPRQFGDWKVDPAVIPLKVSPDVQARLDKIYNQTLARTYVNGKGERVMLSIAYGGDQSDNMQVHRPEVCYTAQGFEVTANAFGRIDTAWGAIPVRRVVARQGARNEPITYWIVVGDRIATRGLEQKLAQLRYGLTGRVPDGMLVRVSSIDRDEARGYAIQQEFVGTLLARVDEQRRLRLAGRLAG
ncbi:MAG: hypothetical protein OHK0018_15460 [Erythrobacter tepidarius]